MKARQKIIDNILATVNQSGLMPWQSGRLIERPNNPITKSIYQGVNWLILLGEMTENGWQDPRFMTFNQAKKAGYSVKKGSASTPICFYTTYRDKTEEKEEKNEKHRRVLRYYNVFNAAQIDGVPVLDASQIKAPKQAKNIVKRYVTRAGLKIQSGHNADCGRRSTR